MTVDHNFTGLLTNILVHGKNINTRNSITKRKLNLGVVFNSTPLISIRKTAWKNALREMEWFLSGSNNINDLHPKVQHWWKPWADNIGQIHNNYSSQLRKSSGISVEGNPPRLLRCDQIKYMINTLKNHPNSRRNVITTWNTAEMIAEETPITNCHGTVIQAFVDPDTNEVHLTMYQRSADMVLGVPHNWIQYWAFLMYLAHQSGRKVGTFNWFGGDCHIYQDHIDTAQKMCKYMNTLNEKTCFPTPDLVYTPTSDNFKADDFTLTFKYEPIFKESLKMTV